ncbi:MAG: Trm112 family protein [bacterium]
MSIDPKFLAILVCPLSHAPLVEDGSFLVSTDAKTRRRYRIENGIPNLLINHSEELDEATWHRILDRNGVKASSC